MSRALQSHDRSIQIVVKPNTVNVGCRKMSLGFIKI
jgi:hypothetical protein